MSCMLAIHRPSGHCVQLPSAGSCRTEGFSCMQTLRGGIPQSASMTSFAAVYGPASDDEGAGLLPPQGVDPLPRVNENGLAAGSSSGTNGRLT